MVSKAILLDRDGVIIKERGEYNYLPEHLQWVEGIEKALLELQEAGYRLIVISNQGGVARRIYSHNEVRRFHEQMLQQLITKGIHIDKIYYCPHHEEVQNCLCRKPKSLLIERAIARFHLDKHRTFFVGDQERDIQAARRAGIEAIRIPSNAPLHEYITGIIK